LTQNVIIKTSPKRLRFQLLDSYSSLQIDQDNPPLSSQVTFIYIALFAIRIVSKQHYGNNRNIICV